MAEQQKNVMEVLQSTPPLKIAALPQVQGKFVSLFNTIHGTGRGQMVYEAEKFHFAKQIQENKGLQLCAPLSLYGAFLDVAVQGLSFDPTKKLCYLVPYNVNIGTKEEPVWEKRANLQISPYGELYLRQEYGQIKAADNPEVVFEGEPFTMRSGTGGKTVSHEISLPRPANGKIVACYVRLVKPDDTEDYFIMDMGDWERLRKYSEKKNRGQANSLYTNGPGGGPDKGFIVAKTIKHAFKSYPKVRVRGEFTKLETEEVDNQEEQAIDYGLAVPVQQPAAIEEATPTQEEKQTPIQEINTESQETAQMTMPNSKDDGVGF